MPWKLVSVPASNIDLQWLEEESNLRICVIRKCNDDAFEVAVEPSYLSKLKDHQLQVNVDHQPTQPSQAEKDVLGICEAKERARDRWLQQVVDVVYSQRSPQVK